MEVSNAVEVVSPTTVEAQAVGLPESVDIRPAQTEYLKAVFSRLQKFEDAVFPKLKELRASFQEAVFFVRKDLGIPSELLGDYRLNEDATKFVKVAPIPTTPVETEPPTPQQEG